MVARRTHSIPVGVEQPGSSSHGDTAGEGSVPFPINDQKFQFLSKFSNWFSHIGVTSQSYLYKNFFLMVLIKLKYQPEEQEVSQDPYIYQNL